MNEFVINSNENEITCRFPLFYTPNNSDEEWFLNYNLNINNNNDLLENHSDSSSLTDDNNINEAASIFLENEEYLPDLSDLDDLSPHYVLNDELSNSTINNELNENNWLEWWEYWYIQDYFINLFFLYIKIGSTLWLNIYFKQLLILNILKIKLNFNKIYKLISFVATIFFWGIFQRLYLGLIKLRKINITIILNIIYLYLNFSNLNNHQFIILIKFWKPPD
uniref:Uncharacterized protein n=1 Tax=Arthrobotrys musiformis TaxID=47236 RepID=A0A482EBV6_9PEZI|nr:hypothetical protein [Arthrobotrys musiformis]QBM31505.1 hypothetical protein [Arthrobotrys musiformis]QBM31655.1 hypothetical protein [Arthrobotrys musiformis]